MTPGDISDFIAEDSDEPEEVRLEKSIRALWARLQPQGFKLITYPFEGPADNVYFSFFIAKHPDKLVIEVQDPDSPHPYTRLIPHMQQLMDGLLNKADGYILGFILDEQRTSKLAIGGHEDPQDIDIDDLIGSLDIKDMRHITKRLWEIYDGSTDRWWNYRLDTKSAAEPKTTEPDDEDDSEFGFGSDWWKK
jgi:hypothetical protein